ncbi:Endonuclease V [Manis pentadactyla]|nr:Endonuclease V [Manis pentadactyla]
MKEADRWLPAAPLAGVSWPLALAVAVPSLLPQICMIDVIFVVHHPGWRNGNSEKTCQPRISKYENT